MRNYTYSPLLARPILIALSLTLLASVPTILGMEGGGMMIASRNGMAVTKSKPKWFGKNAFTLDLSEISEPYDFHFTEGTFDWGSSVNRVAIFLDSGSSSFKIDWGDGSQVESYTASTKDEAHHEYLSSGIYTVVMSNDINTYSIRNCPYLTQIISFGKKNTVGEFYWAGVNGHFRQLFSNNSNLSYVDFSNANCVSYASILASCPNLETLILPDSTEYIGEHIFTTWGQTTKVNGDIVLPSGLLSIGNNTFRGCPLVSSVEFPAGFTDITGQYSFFRQQFDIIMNPTTPPTCNANGLVEFNGKIFVPASSVEAYKTADVWKDFASVIFPLAEGGGIKWVNSYTTFSSAGRHFQCSSAQQCSSEWRAAA